MLFQNIILPGVLVPAIAAALVYLATTLIRVPENQGGSSRGGASLALAAAFLSSFVALTGWPRFPPVGSTQRLFYLVALAGVVGLVVAWRRSQGLSWVVRGILCGLLLGFMLQSKLANAWSPLVAALWLAGLFAVGLAMAWALETNLRGDGEKGDLRLAAVRLALLGATALVLGLSGSARLAQLAGAVACGVFVVEVLARIRGRRPWSGGDAAVVSMAMFGLLLSGYFYASLKSWPAVLVVTAFLLLALPAERFRGGWLAPLVPLVVAVVLVVYALMTKPEDPYDYYGALDAVNGGWTWTAASSTSTLC